MSFDSNREKILNAALNLFSSRGYDGTSVDDIASECRMKAPNLYRYFKGKEEIFKCIDSIVEDQYKSSMGMGLNSMLWIHNAVELKTFSMHQIMFTLTNENVIKVRKMTTIEQFRNEFLSHKASDHQLYFTLNQYSDIFSDLIKYGQISEDDPAMLALEYISPVTVLIQLCDREPDKKEEILKKIECHIDRFIDKYFIKGEKK